MTIFRIYTNNLKPLGYIIHLFIVKYAQFCSTLNHLENIVG